MAIKQSIWSLDTKSPLQTSELKDEKELEDLIYENISVIDPNLLVIGRQIQTQGGPLDILCLDSDQNTVVIELKKDRTPREVTAQALDYASCISRMSYLELLNICTEQGIDMEKSFKDRFGDELDPEAENGFNQSTRIIIVAARMDDSTQRIVEYLKSFEIDINVLFFSVFVRNGERLLSRAWMIDDEESRKIVSKKIPWNGEYYCVFKEGDENHRRWDDARKFGFFSAGGGSRYTNMLYKLKLGDRIWLHVQGNGYCGYGEVIGEAKSAYDTVLNIDGKETEFFSIPGLKGNYFKDEPEKIEHIVPVKWIHEQKVKGEWQDGKFFGNQNIVSAPRCEKWDFTVKWLKDKWKIDD